MPFISKTGLSLYFASNRAGGFGGLDLWVSQRASLDSPWGTPQNLGQNINTAANEQCAHLPPDGHTLLFASTREGSLGEHDLYVARRRNQPDDFGWDFPESLGGGVNTASNELTPGYLETEDGTIVLYFLSNCPIGRKVLAARIFMPASWAMREPW